jgi:hypothetical protein
MNMMKRPGLLNLMNYRYLKLSTVLMLVAITTYLVAPVGSEPYGGTWLGYVLGIVSALIVLLLLWYGIAKRRLPRVRHRLQSKKIKRSNVQSHDAQSGGTQQGRLSLHIYLGASLIVLATLHTGFQSGWNVHTLSYVLMLLVIASGFFGVYAYLRYPRLITRNIGDETLDDLLLKINELDRLAHDRALGLPDEVNALVLKARQGTRLGGNLLQQLRGDQRDCPTRTAVEQVLRLGSKYISDGQPKLMRELYSVLLHKEKLVLQARHEIMLKARLQFWLYLHAPLSIALLAALIAHVTAVLFYW